MTQSEPGLWVRREMAPPTYKYYYPVGIDLLVLLVLLFPLNQVDELGLIIDSFEVEHYPNPPGCGTSKVSVEKGFIGLHE